MNPTLPVEKIRYRQNRAQQSLLLIVQMGHRSGWTSWPQPDHQRELRRLDLIRRPARHSSNPLFLKKQSREAPLMPTYWLTPGSPSEPPKIFTMRIASATSSTQPIFCGPFYQSTKKRDGYVSLKSHPPSPAPPRHHRGSATLWKPSSSQRALIKTSEHAGSLPAIRQFAQ